MSALFDRAAILDALDELLAGVRTAEINVGIHVLGGSAVALLDESVERRTNDIDTWIRANDHDRKRFDELVADIARRRRWPTDWLNSNATQFLPDDGEPFAWRPVLDGSVLSAPPDLLLAMKLRSGRGHRDTDDLQRLVDACLATTREDIEAIFDRFFPRDVISGPSLAWLDRSRYMPAPVSEIDELVPEPKFSAPSGRYVDTYLRNGRWVGGYWR